MPRSRPFVEYATGPRAAALLAVTPDWWGRPDVVGVKYEDCVRDTEAELRRIESSIRPGPRRVAGRGRRSLFDGRTPQGGDQQPLLEGLAGPVAGSFRPRPRPRRSPRQWPSVCAILGYDIDPDPTLTAAAADRNWVSLVGNEIKETLRKSTAGHKAQIQERLDRIAELDAHIAMLEAKLRESVTLSGPVARRVKGVWNREPAASECGSAAAGATDSKNRMTSSAREFAEHEVAVRNPVVFQPSIGRGHGPASSASAVSGVGGLWIRFHCSSVKSARRKPVGW